MLFKDISFCLEIYFKTTIGSQKVSENSKGSGHKKL